MTCDTDGALLIQRGSTWRQIFIWSTGPVVFKAITAVVQPAPLRLTVPNHGLVDDIVVAISNVRGMVELNAEHEPPVFSEYTPVTVIDVDTIELNGINAADFHDYESGGFVRFFTPVDLTGFLARMDIKDRIDGTLLVSLTTTNGGVTVDNARKKITTFMSDEDTALITWNTAVYSLEMEDAGGEVIELIENEITVTGEVTTTETP